MSVGICAHSAKRIFERSNTDVGGKDLDFHQLSNSFQRSTRFRKIGIFFLIGADFFSKMVLDSKSKFYIGLLLMVSEFKAIQLCLPATVMQ